MENRKQEMAGQFIVVEGNIGAGKTTLSKRIADTLHARLVLEAFEDNSFLPKFYQDMDRYAFPLELSFLADRYKQLMEEIHQASLLNQVIVADYYLMKSYIFAKNTLSGDEFQLYKQYFDLIYSFAMKPNVMFYIHREVDVLKQNIRQRGRSYEGGIEDSYLLSLQKGYLEYFKDVEDFPIVIIDASGVDFEQELAYAQFVKLLGQEFENGITYAKIH